MARINCIICNSELRPGTIGVMCPHCQAKQKRGDTLKPYNPNATRVLPPDTAKTYTTFTMPRYGLSVDQQRILYGKQDGRCGICGKKQYLVLNHDYQTKKARGYLCRGCNTKLAGIDDAEYMRRARYFLDNPPVNKL